MSHVSYIETNITDLDALGKAAEACGLELILGQTTMKWFGRWVNDYHGADAAYQHGIDPADYGKCDHAIRVPNDKQAYEIGVLKQPDGTYRLYYDHYGQGAKLMARIGRHGEKLNQQYVKAKAVDMLAKKGFKLVEEEGLAGGAIKLKLQGKVSL